MGGSRLSSGGGPKPRPVKCEITQDLFCKEVRPLTASSVAATNRPPGGKRPSGIPETVKTLVGICRSRAMRTSADESVRCLSEGPKVA